MKTTDSAELTTGAIRTEMKQRIPMEWMGPATWQLPSGKALAEFALQAGFLAPLLLGDGHLLRKTPVVKAKSNAALDTARETATKAVR